VARNLTGERRADRALRSGEARWRSIVESAVDGVITIDRRGRVASFNPAAERLFGYRSQEVIGHNVAMLMPAPYATEHDHYLRRYLDTREARIIGIGREVTGRRKDGTTFPMHLSVGEASIDGETSFTGIVRDLTERVAMEARLREESELARIGELAAVLAHEVKNPLAAVSGAVQMISEVLPVDSDERAITAEILHRVDGLSALMGDLLLYARPPRPNPMQTDAAELVHGLIAFFRQDPDWRGLDVEVRGSASIFADPELLKITLQNLLLNAAQAMHGRGRLLVELEQINGLATIGVTDSGPGIAADAVDRVFTPFFTTKARGTGLGLATVKRIAEAHGGKISIAQTSGTGTTMRLTLPAEGPQENLA
jgi:PAS domain S-box-containing protein